MFSVIRLLTTKLQCRIQGLGEGGGDVSVTLLTVSVF